MFSLLLLLAASGPTITTDGLDPFKVGKPLWQVDRELRLDTPQASDDERVCAEYTAIGSGDDLRIMFEREKLTRVTIIEKGYKTASGIGVGSTEAQLRAAYGPRLKVERQAYGDGPQDKSFYYWSTSGNGIRFDTRGGRVTAIYAGSKSIQYIEGCL